MKNRHFLKQLVKYIRVIGILTAINLAVTGLVCWIGGWWGFIHYSNGLMYSGGLFLLLGGMSMVGNINMRANPTYQYVRTAGKESLEGRAREDLKSTDKSFKFLLIMGLTGAVSMLLSILAGKIGVW